MDKMFCFQCEQTAGGKGCTGNKGVCGKEAETANSQDALTGNLIGLARTIDQRSPSSEESRLIFEALFATITNVDFDVTEVDNLVKKVNEAKNALPNPKENFDLVQLWDEGNDDIRSLKSLILFGVRGIAAYAFHAMVLGYTDAELEAFTIEALKAIGEELSSDDLLALVMKTGEMNLRVMEILHNANTETYGVPEPTTVSMTIEKGPFIVITGHDLLDLYLLLEQTKDKGINIYTHGEMLPAHAYPKLKAYPHLKGNFGTAWQNQQKEFENIPRGNLIYNKLHYAGKG